jgi:co-chaperonin GroES (HSP10)
MSLLEERVKKYEIPEVLYQPVFDRVLVYQIPTVESDTFAGSCLVKPEATKKREKNQSPRGVLVAAGQKAMDIMADHGIQLGDVVWFARMTMWRHEVDATLKEFAVIRAGEICGSEDLTARVESGEVKFERKDGQTRIVGSADRCDPEEWSDQ